MKRSEALKAIYKDHPIYKNRLDTDTLFAPPAGSISFNGETDRAARFIEGFQLLSPTLWARFVTQFKNTVPKADDADEGWRGEYWGKMMRGACFTYKYTQNKELYAVLEETVRDMLTVQEQSGRISSYSVGMEWRGWDVWARKYVLLGMQYFTEICPDEELKKELTESMCRQLNYIIDRVGKGEKQIEITLAASHWRGLSSSSLLEPVVRLYNMTGISRYREFANYIIECGGISDEGVSIFELAYEDKLYPYQYPVVKAYEMMSCFEGLLEYYRVNKNEHYKTAVVNFAKAVIKSDITVIGSAGCTHELFDNSANIQTNTLYNGVMQETCVTVTWMKFCYQLLSLTGDPVFADEIERSLYNAMIGSVNFNKVVVDGNDYLPFDSYSPLLFNSRMRGIGGKKVMADGTFYGCCACIGATGTGLIGSMAAMLGENGVTVNIYENGVSRVRTPLGKEFVIRTETAYPADGTVDINIDSDTDEEFTLSLRIPAWSEKTLASFNGESVEVTPGTYAEFRKVWKKGDYITLRFDMKCKLIKAPSDPQDPNSPKHVALRRGPLTLARDSRLSGNIESVVSFTPDAEGYVPYEVSKCSAEKLRAVFCCKVRQSDGSYVEMIDYASAGSTWDDNSMTTVWMPTENYWTVDFTSPIVIQIPEDWDRYNRTTTLYIDKSTPLSFIDKFSTFCFEPLNSGLYMIKAVSPDTGYLSVSGSGDKIVLSDTGMPFRVQHYAQNKYRIFAPDGRGFLTKKREDSHKNILTTVILTSEAPYATTRICRFINAEKH